MRLVFLAALLLLAACDPGAKPSVPDASAPAAPRDPTLDPFDGKFTLDDALVGLTGTGTLTAKIETSHGTLIAKLYEKEAPVTVANFVGLARGLRPFRDVKSNAWVKRPFYDGMLFHRVIPGFIIQSGCPLGTGKGGPGYKFADEFSDNLKHDKPGVLGMANDGPIDRATNKPGTNGSQFYFNEAPSPHLDNHHTVFGVLVDGFDVQKKIAAVPTGPGNKPVDPVTIQKITIYRQ